ncbi:MAG TPA: bifunctional 5,10-methylenetetrahydrofolate dehydrogenase/5,10-methenyltetrahydrofolate cyclohydrolase [Acidobacteriota bacterium]|nr:bifunctional 5,10-methylenetetrahydrofolate dehydrogenase/5,10-methenyltetrahydrofolate cyclohydrolase [Acidobacteriota bacterium]
MAQVLDGKGLAETIRKEIAADVASLRERTGVRPKLAAVLVGDDPASHIYVRNKVKASEEAGILSDSHYLPADATQGQLLELLTRLNGDQQVHGILLQLPLPKQINKTAALDAIAPSKDVDGLHPWNVGLLVQTRASLIACTPLGVLTALKRYNVPLAGANTVVVGRSDLVGKPVALLLMHENATVTICHSKTRDLPSVVSQADIVVAAMGKPAFLTPDFIKPGAVVIDVGINVLKSAAEVESIFGAGSKKLEDFNNKKNVMVGDVHPASYQKSSLYTPVPGGVGPLTIAMLLSNTVTAAKNSSLDR